MFRKINSTFYKNNELDPTNGFQDTGNCASKINTVILLWHNLCVICFYKFIGKDPKSIGQAVSEILGIAFLNTSTVILNWYLLYASFHSKCIEKTANRSE